MKKNHEFTIVTNTANSVRKFKKDIKEKIKEAGNDIFNDTEADHLMLWQVWIDNSDKDKILGLTLDTKSKNIKKLEGIIGDYWAEQPCKESTHVIVKLNSLMISSQKSPDDLRKQYIGNKTIDPTKEEAENLGEREIFPILDPGRSKFLDKIKDEFWKKFKKNVPFSSVCEALVDDKEVIVVFIDPLEETSFQLPAKFKGFPVFICYEAFELHHRSFRKDLMPGISIGNGSDIQPNASTLRVLFQNTAELDKFFILTVKHGVGKEGDSVVQPGMLEKVNTFPSCAKVTKYNFTGADGHRHYLDYAFCETEKDREIPKIPNMPIGINIQIHSIKTSISNKDDYLYVKKVGRTTYLTEGLVKDKLEPFRPPTIKKKNRKKSEERPERFALRVYGINKQAFGEHGDSGSPVFDDDGKLWGIYVGGFKRVSYVVPIHFILDDVQRKFNDVIFTLSKPEPEDKSFTGQE
ncbi:hypothetical protein C1645_858299 [Glomus cerebriforme]|uniref:Crinkler effector protein N-terminal domain-containing protein n=1 Tax=Glomus cerebriforme TaxID=658196 RepID=A0A397SQW9_9GLOM|nr:hypothetical protein C1645_858299 [Glomus cerebriforme]